MCLSGETLVCHITGRAAPINKLDPDNQPLQEECWSLKCINFYECKNFHQMYNIINESRLFDATSEK